MLEINTDSSFSNCQNWGSRRIDDGKGKLISSLRQVMTGEGVYGNTRDDRREGLYLVQIVLDNLDKISYNSSK